MWVLYLRLPFLPIVRLTVLFLFFNIFCKMFIYLARPGFSCSMRDLWSSLRLAGSLVTASELLRLRSKESTCQCRTPGSNPWVRKIPWRRKWQPIPVFLPGKSLGAPPAIEAREQHPYEARPVWASQVALVAKNLPANAGDMGPIPGSGRSPGEENGNPLQYSCLENPMDRGGWRATVHGVAESQTLLTRLST